jgi:putative transposase
MIVQGFTARLYPTKDQALRLNQWAGSLRFLWNRLLDAETAEYAATGKFLWKKQLQPIAVGMKRQPGLEWLADLPAHAVLDTSARMDGALRRMVSERKAGRECGFPKAKKKFVNEAGIYCVGQASEVRDREVTLPKLGKVKMRGGTIPEGRLLAARVSRDGARWMLSAQFESARPAPLEPTDTAVAIDLGVATLMTAFDGSGFDEVMAPKHLRKAQKRLRRLQRSLSCRKKGSARRRAQARRVGVMQKAITPITPIRRTALSGGVAAIAGTALALLGDRAAAAAGPAGVGPEADPVLALWCQYLDMAAAQDRAWRLPNVWRGTRA